MTSHVPNCCARTIPMRIPRLSSALGCLCFLVFGVWSWSDYVAADEPITLDEITAGLAHSKRLFLDEWDSFRIVYAREKSEKLGPMGGLATAEWIIASKDDKWFLYRRFLNPSESGEPGSSKEPEEPTICVAKDKKVLEWDRSNRQCVVDNFEDGRNMYSGSYYFRNMGLDICRYIAESGGANYEKIRHLEKYARYVNHPFLPDFLQQNPSKYRVRPEKENVDGIPCWVVEWPGMDCIWIDPDHGFAVRRRAYHWAPEKPLRFEMFNRDFREVAPGIWLPFTQAVDRYANYDMTHEAAWGKIINKSVYQVKAVEIGNVQDAAFEVRAPAGTFVTDVIRDIQYRVAIDSASPFEGPIWEGRSRLRRAIYRALLAVAGASLLFIVALVVMRRWKRSQTARTERN